MTIRIHRKAPSPLPDRTVRRIAAAVWEGERRPAGGRPPKKTGKASAGAELSIVLCDDAFIRELNVRFLRKDRPTDVIAFALGEDGGAWGEVYVSVDRTAEQAAEYKVTPEQELARCVIHGILHLSGYDDATKREREGMRRKEDEYLKKLGL